MALKKTLFDVWGFMDISSLIVSFVSHKLSENGLQVEAFNGLSTLPTVDRYY